MIGRRRFDHGIWGVGGTLLIAVGASTGGGAAAVAQPFFLSITGAEGTRYTGRCTLATVSGEETIELSGVVPYHEQLEGEGLACRVESDGRMVVEVARDSGRSRSATSGGVVDINVR